MSLWRAVPSSCGGSRPSVPTGVRGRGGGTAGALSTGPWAQGAGSPCLMTFPTLRALPDRCGACNCQEAPTAVVACSALVGEGSASRRHGNAARVDYGGSQEARRLSGDCSVAPPVSVGLLHVGLVPLVPW